MNKSVMEGNRQAGQARAGASWGSGGDSEKAYTTESNMSMVFCSTQTESSFKGFKRWKTSCTAHIHTHIDYIHTYLLTNR